MILSQDALSNGNKEDTGYRIPPPEVMAIVDAAPTPAVTLSPDRSVMLLLERPNLPGIEELAQPELRLAGIRINPVTNGPSQPRFVTGLVRKEMQTLDEKAIGGLPEHPRITSPAWSPCGRYLAFLHTEQDGITLWLADVSRAVANRLGDFHVNDAYYGGSIQWRSDSDGLYIRTVPKGLGEPPAAPLAPEGPVVQENLGRRAPARTYQDLLQNRHDEDLFDYYFTSEIIHTDLEGTVTRIAGPGVYRGVNLSPDGKYLLVSQTLRPYSYTLPAFRFPNRIEVLDSEGRKVHLVADLPLQDAIPIGFGAVGTGPRSVTWRNDAPSTLVWTEAQDGGDPRVEADVRDKVFVLDAPFDSPPRVLAELAYRNSGIVWGNDDLALITERWWANRMERVWKVRPGQADPAQVLVRERSFEDRYGDPGRPVLKSTDDGQMVLLLSEDGRFMYLTGAGASPEGNRPFLDRFEIASGETERLWQSESPYYESVAALLDDSVERVLLLRQARQEPPNYFVRDMTSGTLRQITAFEHPNPDLRDVSREMITYERADGVPLSGQLYLPPGYDPERDGRLPLVIWAYPREFRSADAAGQITGSPYQFTNVGYWGPQWLVTQGYAVLDNATMPVVGEGDKEPNDTFIEQLVKNAQAAVDAVAEMGIADPERAAIGGHSYGAFMTANILAHSEIFRAGIARSGAYNRSLTPFGFQREERTIWDDTGLYITMSPFFNAHTLKTPILLIHGAEDNNSGTFPMQSERLFAALQGLGGTTRLVMLPHESHGYRARESVMHMLWETLTWLDTYVKEASDDQ